MGWRDLLTCSLTGFHTVLLLLARLLFLDLPTSSQSVAPEKRTVPGGF